MSQLIIEDFDFIKLAHTDIVGGRLSINVAVGVLPIVKVNVVPRGLSIDYSYGVALAYGAAAAASLNGVSIANFALTAGVSV